MGNVIVKTLDCEAGSNMSFW